MEKLLPANLTIPIVASFLLALLFFPPYIRLLRRIKFGQFIREEGPKAHLSKSRTPTAGGVAIIVSCILPAFIFLWFKNLLSVSTAAVLLISLACGLVGLADDLAKLLKKQNAGISAWTRLFLEFLLGGLLSYVLYANGGRQEVVLAFRGAQSAVPFHFWLMPLWFYILFSAFLMAATTNALNLHDGLDGLEAGTASQVFAALAVLLFFLGKLPLAVIALFGLGAMLGFLVFNCYPAKIFMGDTGSLFVGGLMASLVVASGLELWFVPLALIYIIETLSVMSQVLVFKLTKPYQAAPGESPLVVLLKKLFGKVAGQGKRLFRMAPLHHHFEALAQENGISEPQVTAMFWLGQFFLCYATVLAFFLSLYF